MTDDEMRRIFDRLSRLKIPTEVEALTNLLSIPSPASPSLADITTNAVFIDGTGKHRAMQLSTFTERFRVPLERRLDPFNAFDAFHLPQFHYAEFALSTVIDGKAVYRLVRTENPAN